MSYRKNDLQNYTPSKTSKHDRTIHLTLIKAPKEWLSVIYKHINQNLNIFKYMTICSLLSVQAFSLGEDDIKWCNVAAWITALGLVSLIRTDPDRLVLKLLSMPLGMKFCNGQGRYLTSRDEHTSKITPIIISNLQLRKIKQWITNTRILNVSTRISIWTSMHVD